MYIAVRIRVLFVLLALWLCACKPAAEEEGGRERAILGAVLIDGAGGPPLADSVVLIGGGRIRAVGRRSEVPIPDNADRINGSGKYLVPALVDLCDKAEVAGLVRASSAEDARQQVSRLAAAKAPVIYLDRNPAHVVEAALEAARADHIPATARFATQSEARLLVDGGVSNLIGMIHDTEDLDSALLARWRNLRIPVAPVLSRAGPDEPVAKRNTLRVFRAGVPVALASLGDDLVHEAELLADAGIPPLDVLAAAARGANIAAGRPADLLLLDANPGEDVRNLRRVVLRFHGGALIK